MLSARKMVLKKIYYVKSSRNAYLHGEEHLDEYSRKNKGSVMWRHCRFSHKDFTMPVTGMYRRNAMLREVSEAVARGNASMGTIINTKEV